jgi:uncharacterized protein YjbI with pentapeptide repeats
MIYGMPFFGKFQIGMDGPPYESFSTSAGAVGTVLVAYVNAAGEQSYGFVPLVLQLIADVAGATAPTSLPFMLLNASGNNLQPSGFYPLCQTFQMGDAGQVLMVNTDGGGTLTEPGMIQWQALGIAAAQSGIVPVANDYSWADLSGESMNGIVSPNSIFSFADLTNVTLQGSSLPSSDFRNVVSFSGTNLTGATMPSARFDGAQLAGMDFTGAILDDAVFTGATLTNAVFGATGSLQNTDFSGAALQGADFTGANLAGAIFDSAELAGAQLGGTNLVGASFANCDLSQTLFSTPPLLSTSPSPMTSFSGATLDYSLLGLNWSYLNLSSATIHNLPASLAGLDARYANLSRMQLSGLDLQNAIFSNATLQAVTFGSSNLAFAQFDHAQLQGDSTIASAVLSGCNLMDANFTGANLTSVDFSNAYFWGSEATVAEATLLLANFAGAYLSGMNFAAVLDSNFKGATFTNACLVNAIFSNCDILDFEGKRTDFDAACLQGATFEGATVDANLYNAAVASRAGQLDVTIPIGTPPTPQKIRLAYPTATIGLRNATTDTAVCPDGSNGPCSLPSQLIGPDPPASWQPAMGTESQIPECAPSSEAD